MQVGIAALRADLKRWLDRVKAGEEVIVTDRGVPVARLIGVGATPIVEQLAQEGVIRMPRKAERPRASKRRRVPARGSVSEIVSEQRD